MNLREWINQWLVNSGNVIERTMPAILKQKVRLTIDFDFLVRYEIMRRGNAFSFVQIGANDGVSRKDDLIGYIQDYTIKGVMVEPQSDLFKQLQDNLKQYNRIKLINKAIHRNRKRMTMYRLDQSRLASIGTIPHWALSNGIASFDRSHVLAHARRMGLGEEAIEKQVVDCMTLSALLEMEQGTPDLLKIDAEGYDYEILSMLDVTRHCPSIIHFEHRYFPANRYELIISRLHDCGYLFIADKMNTTAYLKKEDPHSLQKKHR